MKASADVSAQDLTWYDTTVAAERDRSRLAFDLSVDACVIGGGLAGLTAARELARRGWSVAVLEAQSLAWNASGRNCGLVLPGFAETISRIADRVGLDQARALWALADAGRAYVRDTIRETGMPGVDPVDGWLRVAKFAEDADLAANAAYLRDQFGADVEAWPTEQVRNALRSPLYFNAIHVPGAFHIHPLNYALGLAAAAERAGVRIFGATPALELDPAGVRKRVVTPLARVRAAKVVLAGSVHLGPLQPRLAATLMPIWTFVAVTAPLGGRIRQAIRFAGAVSDSDRADSQYRIVDGDRLLWSGGVRTWPADPRPFAHRLCADIRRTYPQLGKVEIEHVWSGTIGRTVHQMPQIGEISPGIWVATGFGGHGLNTTAMAGVLIARAIAENDTAWRLFQPYELVWTGGAAGRSIVQVSEAAARLRDRARVLSSRWLHRKAWRALSADSAEPVDTVPAKGTAPTEVDASGPEAASPRQTARSRRSRRRNAPEAASVAE